MIIGPATKLPAYTFNLSNIGAKVQCKVGVTVLRQLEIEQEEGIETL